MSTRRDVLLALPLLGAGWAGVQSMIGGPVGPTAASAPSPLRVASARMAVESRSREVEPQAAGAVSAASARAGTTASAP
jgi:hypothetical protein